ncbi:DUF4097 family beta strand repeat-containing protein [Fredinandcohnia sp. QZ13]|uniref:DUF4097 family beta strand repeat-containing protein n=1 Tax=Fredinandcohnia sp. QZ13 TaxID=3073144 RepID=UPI0028535D0D|nr:DUF4097 family beta strand repeat-containing protein [Fredinandcohnia sp. QZ13]MDR4885976.1 DUF4097 family beta strand repeat-containing protein [Fredinandcohnia sp. QZ13]
MIKKVTIVASLLVLIGVIGSAVTYASVNKEFAINDIRPIENETINSIQVNVDSIDVEFISVASMDEARVELVGTGVGKTMNDFSVNEDDQTLSIGLQSENKKWFNFTFYTTDLNLKIFAPEKIYNNIKVNGFSSDVSLQNLQSKTINLTTVDGDVKLENISSEKMNIKTLSGDVKMEEVQGAIALVTESGDLNVSDAPVQSFNARAFTGDISLENVIGPLTTNTVDGDVFISINEIRHAIYGKTLNGDIKIESEKEPSNAQFEVKTLSGDVILFDKYERNAKMGEGTALIQLETVSGDVTVKNK